jgi:hypothetical protein
MLRSNRWPRCAEISKVEVAVAPDSVVEVREAAVDAEARNSDNGCYQPPGRGSVRAGSWAWENLNRES